MLSNVTFVGRRRSTITILAFLLAAIAPESGAQRVDATRVGAARTMMLSHESDGFIAPTPPPRSDDGQKDVLVAGLLSVVLPGLGSFYAGNERHGWTHVLVLAGSVVAMGAGASSCGTGGSCSLVGLGYATYVVNGIWSIFTAVTDARATRPTTATDRGAL